MWKPIETVAKDNRMKLVYCPVRENTYLVSWRTNAVGKTGWYYVGSYKLLKEIPTHWRDLPEPPNVP